MESARLNSACPSSFQLCTLTEKNRLPSRLRKRVARLSLVAGDALVLTGATQLVYQASLPAGAHWASLVAVALIWMLLLRLNGFYAPKLWLPMHQLAYRLFKTSGMSILAGSATFYLLPDLSVPRAVHWNSAILAGVMLVLWRFVHRQVFPVPEVQKRAIVLGPAVAGMQIAEEIQRNPKSSYEVIGFVDHQASESMPSTYGVLGDEIDLPQIVRSHRVNSIVLPVAGPLPERTLKAIADCCELGCELINTSQLYEQLSGQIPVKHITHGWFISISEANPAGRMAYRVGKRVLDVTLSIVGLLATGLAFPILALLIKLDSPGPVLYSQIRTGLKGRPFRIYKFRSMVQEAEAHGATWAQVNDRRVTRLGEFLRKTRLDELPQLYNVLTGEMSLVGPRPERPEFVEKLAQEIPFFNKRQMVAPGLTGWAQVNYPYGASTEDALQKLQYDLYYIKNRSMFLDLEILLRTIAVVVKKQGAR